MNINYCSSVAKNTKTWILRYRLCSCPVMLFGALYKYLRIGTMRTFIINKLYLFLHTWTGCAVLLQLNTFYLPLHQELFFISLYKSWMIVTIFRLCWSSKKLSYVERYSNIFKLSISLQNDSYNLTRFKKHLMVNLLTPQPP